MALSEVSENLLAESSTPAFSSLFRTVFFDAYYKGTQAEKADYKESIQ